MKKIAIITSDFNSHITHTLRDSCEKNLNGKVDIQHFICPGSVELIPVAKQIVERFDGIILIGAIIKGATDHYEYVAQIVVNSFSLFIQNVKIPVIFGVLTTQNEELAETRANPLKMNKGKEFADALLMMINQENIY